MKVHVFASDVMPLRGLPTSGGGLRSWQIVSGLKAAGMKVSYSMPGFTYLYKANKDAISPEDRDMSWSYTNQHLILAKINPQVAIWCSPYSFSLASSYRSDCVLMVDLHGPTNIESCFITGRSIKDTTREMTEKLSRFDHYITVCQEQQHYFTALLCAAGVPTRDIRFSIVPVSISNKEKIQRKRDAKFSMIYSGGFYPWQDPSKILLLAGQTLDELDCGMLHICGSSHKNLSSARIEWLLSELSKMKRVKLHGYVKHDDLIAHYAASWCALDLMPSNLERSLAVTTRTIEYLGYGVPPIYNNYAPLAKYIDQNNAGWCLDPNDLGAFKAFLIDLISVPKNEFDEKSKNALNLFKSEFNLEKTITPLAQECMASKIRPSRENNRTTSPAIFGIKLPRVAVFTQDGAAVRQLRVVQPLDAMKQAGLIAGYTVFFNTEELGPDSFDQYDAIWIQRTAIKPVLQLLENRSFLFDLDDLLIGRPSYTSVSVFQGSIIETLLSRKCTLSVTHERLYPLLKKYIKGKITNRVFIAPNGFDYGRAPVADPARPQAMIWTSIDHAALTTSYEEVVNAIDQFSSEKSLPVYLIGRFDDSPVRRKPKNSVIFGRMDYWRHKAFLAAQPTMIGICPLETHADEATLDYVAAKSDLKMVEYGGMGHPGVYSQSPPYSQSELRAGVLTINTADKWREALETVYDSAYKSSAAEAAGIREMRSMNRLARENWYPALQNALLRTPISKAEIAATLHSYEKSSIADHKKSGAKGSYLGKRVLLFGAGSGGAQTYFSLPPEYDVVAFIDNDINKQKMKLFRKPVIAPEQISNYQYDSIIISSMFAASIEEQLMNAGIPREKIEKGFA